MINPADTDLADGGVATLPPPVASAPVAPEAAQPFAARFIIPADKIAQATADLPQGQREAIRWAAGYCRQRNLHHSDFASLLKRPDGAAYSKDSVYHMFTGGRAESALVSMVEAIERLRRVEEARSEQVSAGFVETRLAKRIFQHCRRAFLRQKMVFLFGDSQIGKTEALREYARRHNHGETKYVRMPTGGALGEFLAEMRDMLGLPKGEAGTDLKRRIIACFDSRMLLIVDECEECIKEGPRAVKGIDTLNFIREIHDKTKCGVVLAGANIFKKRLYQGHHSASLVRLVRRGMPPLQLPAVPSRADLATFAAHFGLPPAPEEIIGVRIVTWDDEGNERRVPVEKSPLALQTEQIRQHGLGRWLMLLTEASDTAREKRKTITWGFVLHAWHTFEQMETIPAEGEKEAA